DGGMGDDFYEVGAGDVILADPGGSDTIYAVDTDWTMGAGQDDLVFINFSGIKDSFTGIGNELDNTIYASNVTHASLFGMGGNDVLYDADYGGSDLHGGEGNDQIFGVDYDYYGGEIPSDQIFGDAGDDQLAGGAGSDTVTGGAGADGFIFNVRDG